MERQLFVTLWLHGGVDEVKYSRVAGPGHESSRGVEGSPVIGIR